MVDHLAIVNFYTFKMNSSRQQSRQSRDDPPDYLKVMKNQADYLPIATSRPVADINIPKLSCDCDDLYYPILSTRHSRCLILNYRKFETKANDCSQTSVADVSSLQSTFKNLGLQIETHDNLSYNQTIQVLERESSRDFSNDNCFVICILSHGSKNSIQCRDRKLKMNKVMDYFNAKNCPTLIGKPKLFLIQTCHKTDSRFSEMNNYNAMPITSPNYSDFLLIKSSTCESHRIATFGTRYIQTLCQVMDRYAKKYDLLTLLTLANRFSTNGQSQTDCLVETVPYVSSSLTRLLLLFETDLEH